MTRRALAALLLAIALMPGSAVFAAAADYRIVTASERGTYIRIGRDLARWVAPAADIALDVVPSAGAAENLRRLRHEADVKLALVQSDVVQAFLELGARGNAAAQSIVGPLRVILPLYDEEIQFVVRADSERNYVHEIRDARINIGEYGSGTALTATRLYRLMYGEPLAEARASHLAHEQALIRLVSDRTIDVVAVVAGQPAQLFADMTPQSRRYIKLLRFDSGHPASQALLADYVPATIYASSYPALLSADVPALAVRTLLVTYDFQRADTEYRLRLLARSLCENLATLQKNGHPKWREVALALPDPGPGWQYYAPTERELRSCLSGSPPPRPRPLSRAPCPPDERLLGLCR